jgi:alkanesulfonate monooxygenase SsuD/methylene tetrahydromethanopterin reductase-like flavin-dependent oxidoreductase (luciferase family)
VITRLLNSAEPVDFSGEYYRLQEAILLPRPQRPGGPPILIGGNGAKLTLPLTARYASEWNAVYIAPDEFKAKSALLDEMLAANGRSPADVRRSLMTRVEIGEDAAIAPKFNQQNPAELRQRGLVLGTPARIVDILGTWEQAGLQRIMLQWLDLDDLDGLETLAKEVLPHLT